MLAEGQPGQYSEREQPANPLPGSTLTEDDAFWLNETLDDGFFAGGGSDMMNIDTNAMLVQDYWLETPSDEGIDWAQWDVWIGNVDHTRPNVGAGPR